MKTSNFGFSLFTFSRHSVSRAIAFLGLTLIGFGQAASPVVAAESWIACDGTVETSKTTDGKTDTNSAPAHDVYAYNDANKALLKYSETRKALDPVFVTGYDDKAIAWANAGGVNAGSSAAAWEGRIDRASMALKMTRKEGAEIMTWTQQCKAASPK